MNLGRGIKGDGSQGDFLVYLKSHCINYHSSAYTQKNQGQEAGLATPGAGLWNTKTEGIQEVGGGGH